MKHRIQAFLLLHALGACQLFSPDAGRLLNDRIIRDFASTEQQRVFFGTNRAVHGRPDCLNRSFTTETGESLQLGLCEVNSPKRRAVGELPQADSRNASNDSFFKIGRYSAADGTQLAAALAAEPGEEVLVFVHGFNVRFEEAVLRAAQIAYDLKFQGAVAVFSWPAGASDAPLSDLLINQTYAQNRQAAAQSVHRFSEFIELIHRSNKRIHLLVHSMGHQVVIPGLLEARQRIGDSFLREAIFNAPDYAADEFALQSIPLRQSARRITLYCSPGDNALIASRQTNGNYRIGLCKRIEGIDVINVNEVDSPALGLGGLGHGYYSGRAVLTDVYQTLLGIDARRRLFVRLSDPGGGEEFILRH
ncbi:MAG: alpha/beta hydrolase [Leptospirales bacterium]|nr:alpha/beta hydrolase [Leptospirales bacterium]